MDRNPKGYEVSEYKAPKVEVNLWMLSSLKKQEIHLKHKPRGKFRDINGWNSGGFNLIGQYTNWSGFF